MGADSLLKFENKVAIGSFLKPTFRITDYRGWIRRILFGLAWCLGSSGFSQAQESANLRAGLGDPQANKKPNIIFIMTDDQGIDAIEGHAWPNDLDCRTPTLARLSAQGRVFGQARVNPLCSPTRASVMTGRAGLQTGVVTALSAELRWPEFSALQNHEYTLGEMLTDAGYETIYIDKWHLGITPDQQADQQGFGIVQRRRTYFDLDDPIAVGDEHVVRMTNFAIDSVGQVAGQGKPFALMYCLADPHSRKDESGREPLGWWKVDESLLPSGEPYYHTDPGDDTDRDRFRAVVEALDTEIGRLLYQLKVIDRFGNYRPVSRTVVFFMSDNGTAGRLLDRPNSGKGSLFEGGIRVPFFVFGANVPADGLVLDRLIQATDIFDTVVEIVDGPTNTGLPRQSISFADDIGWGKGVTPAREYAVSSRGPFGPVGPMISIVDQRYKLICGGGAPGLDPPSTNSFFDLQNDPAEINDLLISGLNHEQELAYQRLRDRAVDYWNASVSTPTGITVDIPITHITARNSADQLLDPLIVGHLDPGTADAVEARIFVRFDIDSIPDRLPSGKTIADVASAQIVLLHNSDSLANGGTDTGRIRFLPATRNWLNGSRSWSELFTAYRPLILGNFDPPPFIVPRRVYSKWTPISFGHHEKLLDAVKLWLTGEYANFGVILIAEPLPNLPGDQQISFLAEGAFLRLTLEP